MSDVSYAETLRNYALQIEHDIAVYDVTGHYTDEPVLPEVPANMRAAAEYIERLENLVVL